MTLVKFGPTFLNSEETVVEVEPGTSLQEAAESASVPMGDACGGNCACSTCHVYVIEGFDSLEEMSDEEDDILGRADAVQLESRLGCQTYVGDEPLTVRISRESQLAFINEHPEHRDRSDDVE